MSPRRPLARLVPVALASAVLSLFACDGPSEPAKEPKGGAKPGTPMADSGLDRPGKDAGPALVHETLPPPAFRFEDVSDASGIDAVNHSGVAGVKEYLFEAVGPGPACLDFDRDGLMDLYVPDGDEFQNYRLMKEPDPSNPSRLRAALQMKSPRQKDFPAHLYRNLGNGRFEDVAERAGVTNLRWGFGALAWDYDADGWTDLFVANFGGCRLYHNNGNGTFTDVAEAVGLAGDKNSWNTCASCGDYDGDGRLDLYVARYASPSKEVDRQREMRKLPEGTAAEAIPGKSCKWRGLDAYCGPVGLEAQYDSLYRQQEDGTFRDVTQEVEMVPRAAKYGFTSYFFDYDGDGLLDIYVANDSEENFLWHQERDGDRIVFRDVAERLGVKFGDVQNAQASMGCSLQDINQDGLLDIFVTNFSHDYNNIYVGNRYPGGVSFKDRGKQMMGESVFYDLSWGCGFYDFDLDTDLDLFVANGHVYKEVDLFERTGTAYEQYPAVFECLEARKFKYREVGPKPFKGPNASPPSWLKYEDIFAGRGLETKKCCRSACFNDFDNDGDTDVLVGTMNGKSIFLRNDVEHGPKRRFLKLIPRMPGTKNLEAVGGVVAVTVPGGPTQTFPIYRCQSFLGTDDPRIPVGVGAAMSAKVVVTWPGVERKQTSFELNETDAAYELTPDGKVTRVTLQPVK
jgi:hypothetical protein